MTSTTFQALGLFLPTVSEVSRLPGHAVLSLTPGSWIQLGVHTHSLRSVPGSAMVLSWAFLSKIFLKTPQAEFVPTLNIFPLQICGSPCLLDNRLLMSIKNPSSQTFPDTSHLPFLGPYCNLMGHTNYFLQSCDF